MPPLNRNGPTSSRKGKKVGAGYNYRPAGGGSWLNPGYLVGGVVLVLLALILIKIAVSGSPSPASSTAARPAPAALVRSVTTIPPATLDAAGVPSNITLPVATPAKTPLLKAGGKPEVLYVGAEYCPYCASERWAMVVALSRFGTFSNLGIVTSSATDVYPNTHTFTFYGSTYTSKYLTFVPVETYTNQPVPGGGYTTLQTPTAQQDSIVSQYDTSNYIPYLSSSSNGSIPFIDIAGRYLVAGASAANLPPALAGLDWTQIASQVRQPSTTIGSDVLGIANALTASICNSTGQQPASVCSSPVIVKAEQSLK